ncbi:hypothetical protein DESUT3_12030 [Desulfuromonas versatilis]|uniref:TonB C-terminal domain-containing protein n=1 Tax=Desulfuromonas versatilis TaxID=2802975 RepID=A0ABM8HPY3_9BACT|nr:energy transducer TonB [Desulfuromonas versatilis]BCR04134.1 hypothetical protein DESUT3_12030 [Desulfuromonas versatilis]
MFQERRQSHLLAAFFILSLLLHLLLIYLLPQRSLVPAPRPEPVYVEVRPPRPAPPRERELDVPAPPEPEQPRETPARRLGPQDQVVTRETAPRGADVEDRLPAAPSPRGAPQPRPQPQTRPQPKPAAPAAPRQQEPRNRAAAEEAARPQSQAEPQAAPQTAPPREKLPDLQSLLTLPQTTVARLESEWRQKYRADVEQGDAVWLDMERDLLYSFFKRFRDNIYAVWNYPARSAERGDEGTCLLKITVNRDGTLRQVQLMESSGHKVLDEEALQAVQKGSPFGPLPRSFTKDELSIFAFFRYNLTRRVIY